MMTCCLTDSCTLQQLAQEALDIQNACNLSGVVHGFSRSISRLHELFPNEGTDFFNHHPIVVLWIDKLADLSNSEERVTKSYLVVEAIASTK